MDGNNNITYREWAPNAKEAFLIGDFSKSVRGCAIRYQLLTRSLDQWNQTSHPMQKDSFGVFEIVLPANNGQPAIPHNSKLKVSAGNAQCRNAL